MRKKLDKIFAFFICGMTVFSILVLGFVIYFIVREALPLFSEVSVLDFLFGSRWMPVDYTGTVSFGIFNFIAATIAVSFTALALALGAGLGAAVFLAFVATERLRSFLYPFVDLLAGIPSVIYGFAGVSEAVFKGRSAHRLLRSGGRDPAGGDAPSLPGVLLLRDHAEGKGKI